MRFVDRGVGVTLMPYVPMWDEQRQLRDAVIDGTAEETVFFVEHEPVVTAGRQTKPEDLPPVGYPIEVVHTDRGGKATWHGPGQLVAYPIVRLAQPFALSAYAHLLEQVVIDVCERLGLTASTVPGRIGVWFPATADKLERKVAAIGVRVSRGVTMHGLALNCNNDLNPYARFIPCGITDADVTSLSAELGREITPVEVLPLLREALEYRLPEQVSSRSKTMSAQAIPAHTNDSAPPCDSVNTGQSAHTNDTAPTDESVHSNEPTHTNERFSQLTRRETQNATVPIERKPPWIKTRITLGSRFRSLAELTKHSKLHTVCQEAGCPNVFECWEDGEATFLIGGSVCSRSCDFCEIGHGKPEPLDQDEPRRVAKSVHRMGLSYATITGVSRDDLADGGAWLYAQTVREIHQLCPETGVELLAPDFATRASGLIEERLAEVFASRPEVFAHNIETVPRLAHEIRPAFGYDRSLELLQRAHDAGLVTKSNLILGMGESIAEVHATMQDLIDAHCDLLTITQYLRPSLAQRPVFRWVEPTEFEELASYAKNLGFTGVMSGPMVRSSYHAGRLWSQAVAARK